MAMVLAGFSLVVLFALAFVLSRSMGAEGIWWSYPIANVLGAILGLAWLWKGDWKKKQLVGIRESNL